VGFQGGQQGTQVFHRVQPAALRAQVVAPHAEELLETAVDVCQAAVGFHHQQCLGVLAQEVLKETQTVAALLLVTLLAGEIVHHPFDGALPAQQAAAELQLQDASVAAECAAIEAVHLALGVDALHEPVVVVLAAPQVLRQGPLAEGDLQQARRIRVDLEDAALQVQPEQADLGVLHEAAVLLLAGGQPVHEFLLRQDVRDLGGHDAHDLQVGLGEGLADVAGEGQGPQHPFHAAQGHAQQRLLYHRRAGYLLRDGAVRRVVDDHRAALLDHVAREPGAGRHPDGHDRITELDVVREDRAQGAIAVLDEDGGAVGPGQLLAGMADLGDQLVAPLVTQPGGDAQDGSQPVGQLGGAGAAVGPVGQDDLQPVAVAAHLAGQVAPGIVGAADGKCVLALVGGQGTHQLVQREGRRFRRVQAGAFQPGPVGDPVRAGRLPFRTQQDPAAEPLHEIAVQKLVQIHVHGSRLRLVAGTGPVPTRCRRPGAPLRG
jgi:hypothetical protein